MKVIIGRARRRLTFRKNILRILGHVSNLNQIVIRIREVKLLSSPKINTTFNREHDICRDSGPNEVHSLFTQYFTCN